MNIVIVNGSPRRKGNTAELCQAFEDGVKSISPESRILNVNLNDYNYKGCQSCFSCKSKTGNSYGFCAFNDDITPLLKYATEADCLVIASPIYLMDVSASTKAFLERLCFPLGSYEKGYKSLAPKQSKVVTIYTMNAIEEQSPLQAMDTIDMFLGHIFSSPKRICAYNTYQFHDYSKYIVDVFDEHEKAVYRDKHWQYVVDQVYCLAMEYAMNGSIHVSESRPDSKDNSSHL